MPNEGDSSNQPAEAEIRSALSALTRTQWRKLYLFSGRLLNSKRIFSEGREGKDLVQDAVLRAYRKWTPAKGDIVAYLYGAVQSIAGHLPERYHGNASEVPVSQSNEPQGDGEDQSDHDGLLERQRAGSPTQDNMAYWNEILTRIESVLQHDPEALELARLIGDHASNPKRGPVIQEQLGITYQEFRARLARMRRAILKAFPEGI